MMPSVFFAFCHGAMFFMSSTKRVIIPADDWVPHEAKLEEITIALSLKNRTQTVDIFRGYGPSVPGTKDWGCMLEEAVDPGTKQPMILFRTDGGYVRWVEASQVKNRSTAEIHMSLDDGGMTEDKVVELMELYQYAWTYAVEKNLGLDFRPAFYDTIPFENLVTTEVLQKHLAIMYGKFPFVEEEK